MNKNRQIKYLSPDALYEQIKQFTSGMIVTKGAFEVIVEKCTLEDVEWNHMDQLHRLSIHNTYEKGIRIATGHDFAVSLTQWKNWPFFITVTDVYVAKGLFYQSLTLAGVVFVHSIISLEQINDTVKLKDEWFIASHKLFKLLHKPLNKKLYKLNARLQQEDEQIRQGRFELRKQGYHFKTDCPDYHNSNLLGANTIYPVLEADAHFSVEGLTEKPMLVEAANLKFIASKNNEDTYFIWPATCPHEGGPLIKGTFCKAKAICPWHGLHFKAIELSEAYPFGSRYGFAYELVGKKVYIKQSLPPERNITVVEQVDFISA
ncbi:MAG: Rieske [2Fe-2S] domain [Gammaproteobacteria bacterium]|jgi:hypothetical protein|nr:Rieske [2Fe-2S] domain [Gammaproteobacteria bacterium]